MAVILDCSSCIRFRNQIVGLNCWEATVLLALVLVMFWLLPLLYSSVVFPFRCLWGRMLGNFVCSWSMSSYSICSYPYLPKWLYFCFFSIAVAIHICPSDYFFFFFSSSSSSFSVPAQFSFCICSADVLSYDMTRICLSSTWEDNIKLWKENSSQSAYMYNQGRIRRGYGGFSRASPPPAFESKVHFHG